MSWRIVFEPAYFDDRPGDLRGADEVVPLKASAADMMDLAKKWAWRLPLRVWVCDPNDERMLLFMQALAENHLMSEQYVKVFVKTLTPEGKTVSKDFEVRIGSLGGLTALIPIRCGTNTSGPG